jgi:hypothetical protein
MRAVCQSEPCRLGAWWIALLVLTSCADPGESSPRPALDVDASLQQGAMDGGPDNARDASAQDGDDGLAYPVLHTRLVLENRSGRTLYEGELPCGEVWAVTTVMTPERPPFIDPALQDIEQSLGCPPCSCEHLGLGESCTCGDRLTVPSFPALAFEHGADRAGSWQGADYIAEPERSCMRRSGMPEGTPAVVTFCWSWDLQCDTECVEVEFEYGDPEVTYTIEPPDSDDAGTDLDGGH